MAWKNGSGTTVELAACPEGAGLADFGWRVSLATIGADGPFSCFEGIDRVLTHVEGGPLQLDVDGCTVRLEDDAPPFAFAGEAAVLARLTNGPVRDLNAMARRDAWDISVTRITPAQGVHLAPEGHTRLCVALEPCAGTSGRGTVTLARFDALMLNNGDAAFVVERAAARMVSLVFASRSWQERPD